MTFTQLMREVTKITKRDGLPMSHRIGRCALCDSTRLRVLKRVLRNIGKMNMSMSMYASREDWAEAMGYDAGRNAPDMVNCHFTIFATPEMTKAWERGKQRGDAERAAAHHDIERS